MSGDVRHGDHDGHPERDRGGTERAAVAVRRRLVLDRRGEPDERVANHRHGKSSLAGCSKPGTLSSHMQTLSWYVRRLQAMSIQEIAWRAQSAARGVTDRGRLALKLYPKTGGRARRSPARASAPRWCPVPLGDWTSLDPGDPAVLWRTRLIDRADRVVGAPAVVLRPVRRQPGRSDRLEPRVRERARPRRAGSPRPSTTATTRDGRLQGRLGAEPSSSARRPGPRLPGDRRREVRAGRRRADRLVDRAVSVRARHELAQPARAGASA